MVVHYGNGEESRSEGKIANFAIIRTALTGKTCSMDRINKGDFFREGWPRDDINSMDSM